MTNNYFERREMELKEQLVSVSRKEFDTRMNALEIIKDVVILEKIVNEIVDSVGGIEKLNISSSSKEKLLKLRLKAD